MLPSGWERPMARGPDRQRERDRVLVQVTEFLAPEMLFEMVLRIPPEVGNLPAGDLVCLGKVTRRSPDMAPPGGYLVAGTFVEFRSADWSSPSEP